MPPKRQRGVNWKESAKKVARTVGEFGAYHVGGDLGRAVYNSVIPENKRWSDRPMIGQGTLTRQRKRYGRKVRRGTNKFARLITRASVSRISYGLNDYSPMGGSYGKYFLRNYFDTRGLTDTTGGYYLPCHLWDVSAVANTLPGGDTPSFAQCGYRIGLTTPLAVNQLPRHRCLGNPLVPVTYTSTTSSSTGAVRANSLLRGVKAKLMFYCPLKVPVRVRVALVQLTTESLHPSKNLLTDTASTRQDQGVTQADNTLLPNDMGSAESSAAAFWADVTRSYASNPVAMGTRTGISNHMKVLRSMSFVMNPKETSDNTATTYHMVDFYHAFNRYQNYAWENSSNAGIDLISTARAQNRCCVQPRARIYLMIVSDGVYTSGAADPPAVDSDNSCSYDICLRTYHDDIV